MNDESFDALLKAVADGAPKLSREEFAQDVAARASPADHETALGVVKELFNFDYLRDDFEMSEKEISSLIASAALASQGEEFSFNEDDKTSLEGRAEKLLSVRKALSITAKTIDVVTDQERVFLKARVLTDFRPVFSEDLRAIDAGVIVHQLTIHFAQDDSHKDFYVAMDTSDIKKLREVLDRADKKSQLLEAMVKDSKVSYISPP